MKRILIAFCMPLSLWAQIGGTNAFSFSNVEVSPRIEAIGSNAIAIFDND
ncbi:MAG: penicillin-binding protein, partial [Flavobacteriales bacterium]|nr:penicillin-binding protein [Flavobacteriales bacterium]